MQILKRVCKLLNMQKVPTIHQLHLSSFTVKTAKVTLLLHLVCPQCVLVSSLAASPSKNNFGYIL